LILKPLSDVQQFALGRPSERQLRTLLSAAAGFALAAFPAYAQSASLADAIAEDASCASPAEARQSLEQGIAASPEATREAILAALNQIIGRADVCEPLREAAKEFADAEVAETLARAGQHISSAPSAIVAARLAEAPSREAAKELADAAVAEMLERADQHISSASSAIVAATLAEAERRAANLKFEVGPPPRFMTKERKSGP
jgi:hypothetical protein